MHNINTGRLGEIKGKIKEQWGKLTDDEIMETRGNLDQLSGKIQQKYGGSKEDIRAQVQKIIEQ